MLGVPVLACFLLDVVGQPRHLGRGDLTDGHRVPERESDRAVGQVDGGAALRAMLGMDDDVGRGRAASQVDADIFGADEIDER